MRSRRIYIFAALFILGLLFRVASVPYMGTEDVWNCHQWGERTNRIGLAESYSGVYFPVQWQIFATCARVGDHWGLNVPNENYHVIHKLVTFHFDLATLLLLVLLLRRWGFPPVRALLYWCHPWFLAVFALGYIDAQFAFFAVAAALLADRARSATGFAIAGLPLGIAFLMKPQAEVLVLVAVIYAAMRILLHRDWRPVAILIGPTVLFTAYSLFFFLHGRPFLFLARSYLGVMSDMPCLTAQMLNIWYPLAHALAPGEPIYTTPDTIPIIAPITVRAFAITLTVTFLALFTYLLARDRGSEGNGRPWVFLLGFASLCVPMLMTGAHENHLFLGTTFLVLLLSIARTPVSVWAVHILLLTQALNLLGHYGLGTNELSRHLEFLTARWHGWPVVVAAIVSVACFLLISDSLVATVTRFGGGWRRLLPGAGLLFLVGVVYTVVLLAA